MMAKEAVDYGIIDKMIQTKTGHITKPPCPSSWGGGDQDSGERLDASFCKKP